MRISDWSSDVCSSDLRGGFWFTDFGRDRGRVRTRGSVYYAKADGSAITEMIFPMEGPNGIGLSPDGSTLYVAETYSAHLWRFRLSAPRSEEHTSELQSLMRNSYAVFCLKNKTQASHPIQTPIINTKAQTQ